MVLGEESQGKVSFAVSLLHKAGLITIVEQSLLEETELAEIEKTVGKEKIDRHLS